jgi:hypothetical protein
MLNMISSDTTAMSEGANMVVGGKMSGRNGQATAAMGNKWYTYSIIEGKEGTLKLG